MKGPKKATGKRNRKAVISFHVSPAHTLLLLGADFTHNTVKYSYPTLFQSLKICEKKRRKKKLSCIIIFAWSFQTAFKVGWTYMSSSHGFGNILLEQPPVVLQNFSSFFVEWILWVRFQEQILEPIDYWVDSQHRFPVFPVGRKMT